MHDSGGWIHLAELALRLLRGQRGRVLVQGGQDDAREGHVGVGRAAERELLQQDAEGPQVGRQVVPGQAAQVNPPSGDARQACQAAATHPCLRQGAQSMLRNARAKLGAERQGVSHHRHPPRMHIRTA